MIAPVMNTDTPMIFTSRGNVPLDSVKREVEWSFNEDKTIIICATQHRADNGEIIQRSVDAYGLGGLLSQSKQASLT